MLIRRGITDGKQKAYSLVFAPPGTTLQDMVKAIGARWRIEDDFETSKAMGLAQYEVCCFIGWYRHITLVMLAHAFLAVICTKNQSNTIVDASPPNISSPIPIEDASFSIPTPSVLSMISTLEISLPYPSVDTVALPTPGMSSTLRAHPATPLPAPDTASLLPVAMASPSLPHFAPAPLTIPEVRHLLGRLIWPTPANAKLVLAWSRWRRHHCGMACYYHTKRRLEAG